MTTTSTPYRYYSTGGARGATPPILGHALRWVISQLRLAMMAECCCRRRLRSLRTRHFSPSERARATLAAKPVVNHSAASRPMPPRVLAAHVMKS